MTFPEKLDVLAVHATLIAETGGQGGLRDEASLESALAAPENRYRHAFLDGHKRVAAAITEAFLETNGFELTMTNEEIVALFLSIASSKLSREQVEGQMRNKVKIGS